MSNIQEIETAVAQLSADELNQFSVWFEAFMEDQWNQKIESVAEADFFNCAGIWANRDDINLESIRTKAWQDNKR